VINGAIEHWQWRKIVEKMYDENDCQEIEELIFSRMQA